jgi:phage baseplate assembly protein W
MTVYSFKSVGKTQSSITEETIASTPIPFGIKTPVQLGSAEGIFAMNYSLSNQFSDNLKNLLLTNWGERLGLYEFGANLRPLVTEFVNQENFDNEAITRIKRTVDKWMPFIDLESFSSTINRTDNKNTGIIEVNITYNIPALNVVGKGLQITLYVI